MQNRSGLHHSDRCRRGHLYYSYQLYQQYVHLSGAILESKYDEFLRNDQFSFAAHNFFDFAVAGNYLPEQWIAERI